MRVIDIGQRLIKRETQEVVEWDGEKWKVLGYFDPIHQCIVPSKDYDIKYPENEDE